MTFAARLFKAHVHRPHRHTPNVGVVLPVIPEDCGEDWCPSCGNVHQKREADPRWQQPPKGLEVAHLTDAIRQMFRRHHAFALSYWGVTFGRSLAHVKAINLDKDPIDLTVFKEEDGRALRPALELEYDKAGKQTMSRLGVSNQVKWSVRNPQIATAIEQHSVRLSAATAATTSQALNTAVGQLKTELVAGLVAEGATARELSNRIGTIFERAERYRADRIARTEASIARHDGRILAGNMSGLVKGYEPLLSPDACPICVAAARRWPLVTLDQAMSGVGQYGGAPGSDRRLPPYHPNCECTYLEKLKTPEELEERPVGITPPAIPTPEPALLPQIPAPGPGPAPTAPPVPITPSSPEAVKIAEKKFAEVANFRSAKAVNYTIGPQRTNAVAQLNGLTDDVARIRTRYPTLDKAMSESQVGKTFQLHNREFIPKRVLGERSNTVGVWQPPKERLALASQRARGIKEVPLRFGRGTWSVSETTDTMGLNGLNRHEIGHALKKRLDLEKVTGRKWKDLHNSHGADWWKTNVTNYSATNEAESFAECFAAYTHPEYGQAARLPFDIDDFFRKALGG